MPSNKKQLDQQANLNNNQLANNTPALNTAPLDTPQATLTTNTPQKNNFTSLDQIADSTDPSTTSVMQPVLLSNSQTTASTTILHAQDPAWYEASQTNIPFYKKELPSPLSWPEPTSLVELEQRLQRLLGRSIAELSQLALLQAPNNSKGAKGYIGLLIELFLGAHAHNLPSPDFVNLGIELKTMPVGFDLMPQESTFICNADLAPNGFVPFTQSALYHKLKKILFVLILAPHNPRLNLGERRVLGYFFFHLSAPVSQIIETDYNEFQEMLLAGQAQEINGTMGTIVQLRPRANKFNELISITNHEGEYAYVKPRGYYLRASFTRQLLQTFIKEQDLDESLSQLQTFKRQLHL